jgi:hypothetical protein
MLNKKGRIMDLTKPIDNATKEMSMDKFIMCSIVDLRAGLFEPPFFVRREVQAERHFTMNVLQNDTLKTFKNDFCVVSLGIFDPVSGSFNEFIEPNEIKHGKDIEIDEAEKQIAINNLFPQGKSS